MNLLREMMNGLGAALLPVATALLFEELTLGGLVRLLLAPRPDSRRNGAAGGCGVLVRGRFEHKNGLGGGR